MSKYVPKVSYEYEFEGDKVTMLLSPLKRADMVSMAPYLNPDEEGNIGTVDSMHMLDLAAKFLPRYVENFAGLTDANSVPISLETVLEDAYFTEMVGDIMARVFGISRMSPGDEKNSGAASAPSLNESSTETS